MTASAHIIYESCIRFSITSELFYDMLVLTPICNILIFLPIEEIHMVRIGLEKVAY